MLKKFSLVLCTLMATIFSGGWLFGSDYLGISPQKFMNAYNSKLEYAARQINASNYNNYKILSMERNNDGYYVYNLASRSQGYSLSAEAKDDKLKQVMIMSPKLEDVVMIIGAAGYACPEISKLSDLNSKISDVSLRAIKNGSAELKDGDIHMMAVYQRGVFIFKFMYVD